MKKSTPRKSVSVMLKMYVVLICIFTPFVISAQIPNSPTIVNKTIYSTKTIISGTFDDLKTDILEVSFNGIVYRYIKGGSTDTGLDCNENGIWKLSLNGLAENVAGYNIRVVSKNQSGESTADGALIVKLESIVVDLSSIKHVSTIGGNNGAIDIDVSGGKFGFLKFGYENIGSDPYEEPHGIDYIDFGSLIMGDGVYDELTLEGWMKLDPTVLNAGTRQSLWGQNNEFELGVKDGYILGWRDVSTEQKAELSEHIDINKWHHIAMSSDNSEFELFIDGRKIGNTTSVSEGSQAGVQNAQAGAGVWSDTKTDEPLKGYLFRIRYWNKRFNADEIRGLMTREVDGSEEGLLVSYNMDEGQGNKVYGVGSNATTGTIIGADWELAENAYKFEWTKVGGGTFRVKIGSAYKEVDRYYGEGLEGLRAGVYNVEITNMYGVSVSKSFLVKGPGYIPPVTFDCQSGFYQIASDKFLVYKTSSESYEEIGTGIGTTETNSYGYNTVDNHIYGLNNSKELIRINKDGSAVKLGVVTGLSERGNSADFGSNGELYCIGGSNSGLKRISIANMRVEETINLTLEENTFDKSRGDIVYIPHEQKFYTISIEDHHLYEINVVEGDNKGKVIDKGYIQELDDYNSETGNYGALWYTKEGYLYAFHNDSGMIYKIRVSDLSVAGRYKATSNNANDGAGCPDQYAPVDSDMDGYFDYQDKDADGDGITNSVENGGVNPYDVSQNSSTYIDTDSDGIPNFLDLDSDNDGIPDNIEVQGTFVYIAPTGSVAGNGIVPQYGNGIIPIDSDGDNIPDYLDSDSDNDNIDDSDEGLSDYYNSQKPLSDNDKDGILNKFDITENEFGDPSQGIITVNDLRNRFISVPDGQLYFRLGADFGKRPPLANPVDITVNEDFVKTIKADFKYSDPDNDSFSGVKIYEVSAGLLFIDVDGDGIKNQGDITINPAPDNPIFVKGSDNLNKLSFISVDNAFDTPKSIIQYKVYDGEVYSVNKYSLNITLLEVNDKPLLQTNELTIAEGATVDITTSVLNSTDADNIASELTYTITALTNGNFLKEEETVTSFTKQDVDDGKISFVHDGSEIAPKYHVKVTDKGGLYSEGDVIVSFTNINDKPVFIVNKLIITGGETIKITGQLLNSTDNDNESEEITYTVLSVVNGNFAKDGSQVIEFTKKDVDDGKISFVHDGSDNAPEYTIKVSDIEGLFSESQAIVTFTIYNAPPVILAGNKSVTENFSGIVVGVKATDEDNQQSELVFSIADKFDGNDFIIDASTGDVTFKVIPDYENPSDSDRDNIYVLKVQVTDGSNISYKVIEIIVLNDNTSADLNNDIDGDGVIDSEDNCKSIANVDQADFDGDGEGDVCDTDDDNDGIPDSVEGDKDTDGDGKPNCSDNDSDNDGITDDEEYDSNSDGVFPDDTDNDGIPDYLDTDSDNDGIPDEYEKDSDGNKHYPDDTDGDGIPDYLDPDSDNDGVNDRDEYQNGDTDNDGLADYLDSDDDGDGISTHDEDFDGNGDPTTDDEDSDGIPNYLDSDSDNDGISDSDEKDSDGDGEGPDDYDKDGIPDYLDTDSDNDGISDKSEGQGDYDGDGIPNYIDGVVYDIPEGFTPDGNSGNSTFRIDNFNYDHTHEFIVYNRWGNKVYHSKEYNNNWDGEANVSASFGDRLPVGTYFYLLIVKETSEIYKGNVYLNK